jgi:hypothetical protein
MNKLYFFSASVMIAMLFCTCGGKVLEVDTGLLQEKIYEPTTTKYEGLLPTTVLYLDHSTCVIDAVRNSQVFKALRPNLGQYCDTLRLIKGGEFESVPLDRQDNKVSEVLETIENDISFADIRKAVFQICNGNQQAILISDCESYANGRFLDLEPYMSEPFKVWLENGHSIYIITEPYREAYRGKIYDKKRFYFIFSDDRIQAPISHNFLGEIQSLLQDNICTLFKMTNADIFVQSPKSNMVANDLTFDVEYGNGYEFIEVSDDWDSIREFVMKLDEYGEPLGNDEGTGKANPVPLVQNLEFNDGENYTIEDVQIVATNITSTYLALEESTDPGKETNISDGFILDENALRNHKLNVMLTDKIFTDGYLSDEFGGNLIRLDFLIARAGLKPYDNTLFEWLSIWSPNTSICVSKSIDNALRDVAVIPTCPNRRLIHTVFLKTQAYK